MGNKRLTPHPSPLPQVEGEVQCSQSTKPLSALVPQCHRASWKSAFTLAETLIVIGIIGVVAALTLPNLNHATGDKETVTRLQKAYSMLNEANDRAVAIYGPLSTWQSSSQECQQNWNDCWMKRVGEFLKISKSCDESQDISCDALKGNLDSYEYGYGHIVYQLSDGMTFLLGEECDTDFSCDWGPVKNYSFSLEVDIDGPQKGKNQPGSDIFGFLLTDLNGIVSYNGDDFANRCVQTHTEYYCANWVLNFGNLDYLKADNTGKCNDTPSIILDGVSNTSCH